MTRSSAITAAVLVVVAVRVVAFVVAGGGTSGQAQAAAQTTTIRGEVVDLACYLGHDLTGPKHASCAASCAQGGAPLGLLDKKANKVYLIVLGHDQLMGAKTDMVLKKLKPYIAKDVVVTGTRLQRGGLNGIAVASVKTAK